MLVILRFICTALLMIVVALVIPDLRLGGRYLILLGALLSTLLAWLFRKLVGTKIPFWKRSFLTGLSIVITLFLVKALFYGVNLTILGILTSYIGAVLLELVLPDHISGGIQHNKKEENLWKH